MLNSYRLGAVAVLSMGALTAGCAGPSPFAQNAARPANSAEVASYASVYDHDDRFYAQRDYRSKCDDESDATQRTACFVEEREEMLNHEDGRDGS